MSLHSDAADKADYLDRQSVTRWPLREFFCPHKLKAQIVTLLGWSSSELLRLA